MGGARPPAALCMLLLDKARAWLLMIAMHAFHGGFKCCIQSGIPDHLASICNRGHSIYARRTVVCGCARTYRVVMPTTWRAKLLGGVSSQPIIVIAPTYIQCNTITSRMHGCCNEYQPLRSAVAHRSSKMHPAPRHTTTSFECPAFEASCPSSRICASKASTSKAGPRYRRPNSG